MVITSAHTVNTFEMEDFDEPTLNGGMSPVGVYQPVPPRKSKTLARLRKLKQAKQSQGENGTLSLIGLSPRTEDERTPREGDGMDALRVNTPIEKRNETLEGESTHSKVQDGSRQLDASNASDIPQTVDNNKQDKSSFSVSELPPLFGSSKKVDRGLGLDSIGGMSLSLADKQDNFEQKENFIFQMPSNKKNNENMFDTSRAISENVNLLDLNEIHGPSGVRSDNAIKTISIEQNSDSIQHENFNTEKPSGIINQTYSIRSEGSSVDPGVETITHATDRTTHITNPPDLEHSKNEFSRRETEFSGSRAHHIQQESEKDETIYSQSIVASSEVVTNSQRKQETSMIEATVQKGYIDKVLEEKDNCFIDDDSDDDDLIVIGNSQPSSVNRVPAIGSNEESNQMETSALSNANISRVNHLNVDVSEDEAIESGGPSSDEAEYTRALQNLQNISGSTHEQSQSEELSTESNSTNSHFDSGLTIPGPSGLRKRGELSPIVPKKPPPPLDGDISSSLLRTAHKTDEDVRHYSNSVLSEPLMRSTGSLSSTNRSFLSTGALQPIKTRTARSKNRSYLSGGAGHAGSLLGREELEKHFPDRRVRVFVSTWNMHEEKKLPHNLEDLILPEESDILQDMYIIGTQESSPDASEWAVRLQQTLGTTHILLHKATLGVLHLLLFIRRDLIWFCSPIEEDSVSTRVGTGFKTKGAVAVSFTFFGTSFLFIVSHFASGDSNTSRRMQDYSTTIKSLNLPIKVPPTRKYNVSKDDITQRFDTVFWCGDFNFRLMESRSKIENWATQLKEGHETDFDILLQHDELKKSMSKTSIFKGFGEGDIRFLPSYKYDQGADVFDTSAKARIPSYTDRVLFKGRKPTDIQVLHYSSCSEIKCSDHRAVYGIYDVKIRPGKDDNICGTPSFAKDVFLEANKRRAATGVTTQPSKGQRSSAICSMM